MLALMGALAERGLLLRLGGNRRQSTRILGMGW